MEKINLGIIGCGNMAGAILEGISSDKFLDFLKRQDIDLSLFVSDLDESRLEKIKQTSRFSITTSTDNNLIFNSCSHILLAVKPQTAPQVFEKNSCENQTIISIMAGYNLAKLRSLTRAKKIVRVMPNLNAKIAQSFSVFACDGINTHEKAFITALLSSFGSAREIDESKFACVTGLCGSSPAFVFMFFKAFIDVAKEMGMSNDEAIEFAVGTIVPSVQNASRFATEFDLDILVDAVCSKGGTTIEGVKLLRKGNMEALVKNAIFRSVERATELEKKL